MSDFFEPASLEAEVENAMSLMYKDAIWGDYMPLSLKQMSTREKLFIVMLFEAATHKKLMVSAPPKEELKILFLRARGAGSVS